MTGSSPEFPVDIINSNGFASLLFDSSPSTALYQGYVLGKLYIHNKQSNTYSWRDVQVSSIDSVYIHAICNFGENQHGGRMYIELDGLKGTLEDVLMISASTIDGSSVISGMCEIIAGEFDWTK